MMSKKMLFQNLVTVVKSKRSGVLCNCNKQVRDKMPLINVYSAI